VLSIQFDLKLPVQTGHSSALDRQTADRRPPLHAANELGRHAGHWARQGRRKLGPAALASDRDEPVVVGERTPAVGAAGADASLAQQCSERAGEARAMLGKKGAPSLFKFGFKVVPREEAAARASARLGRESVLLRQPMLEGGMHQGVRCAGLWAARVWAGSAAT
jgi:hypothetical protein